MKEIGKIKALVVLVMLTSMVIAPAILAQPGQNGEPPGQGGTPPGQGGSPPGLAGNTGWTVDGDNVYKTNLAGNVGIGTTSPTGKLEVVGDIVVSGLVDGVDIDVTVANLMAADVTLQTNIDAEETARIAADNAEAAARQAADQTLQDNIDALALEDAQDYDSLADLEVAVANGFNIATVSGNVGIGTTSPSEKLHVVGNVRISGAIYDSNNQAGSNGQILQSTGTGIDWVDSSSISDGDWTISGSDMYSAVPGNVGIGTTSPGAKLDVDLGQWQPGFHPGGAATIGSASCSATGDYAIAMGTGTDASGPWSIAMGVGTTASGYRSTAMGHWTTASAEDSTAMGRSTTASGKYSTAMGSSTVASGGISTAMGYDTFATGDYSTAMGYRSSAHGGNSTAMGHSITVNGDYSFGIGLDDTRYQVIQPNTMAIMGGNVGIGTVTPATELDVNGDISADNMPGADFTVASSYWDLPTTLTNVKQIELTVNSGGYILVTFFGYVNIDSAGGDLRLVVSDSPIMVSSEVHARGKNGDRIPFSVQYLYSVSSAGTYTYYGNVESNDGLGDVLLCRMSAIYVPTHY